MSNRFAAAIERIDAANADDPNTIVVDGEVRPKEQAHAEMVSSWVRHLDPDAGEHQLIAARAHHLRRWSLPRASYPEGRSGYLRWRSELKKQHAEEVAAILVDLGYDDDDVARVQQIIQKQGLRSDPAVQTHEDALCLVFLQTQLDDTLAKLDDDEHRIDVLRKTAAKMSPEALEIAGGLEYSAGTAALLQRALAG